MATIYDLTNEQLELLSLVEGAETEEELEAIKTTIEVSRIEFNQKVESYIAVISAIEGRGEARKIEADRLKALADRDAKKARDIKDTIAHVMKELDIKSIDTKFNKVSWRKGSPSCAIDNEKLLGEYTEIKEVTSIDKRRLLSDMKAGKVVEGAHIHTGAPSLTIK